MRSRSAAKLPSAAAGGRLLQSTPTHTPCTSLEERGWRRSTAAAAAGRSKGRAGGLARLPMGVAVGGRNTRMHRARGPHECAWSGFLRAHDGAPDRATSKADAL
eukprot:gene15143-biopygen12698